MEGKGIRVGLEGEGITKLVLLVMVKQRRGAGNGVIFWGVFYAFCPWREGG